MRLGPVLALLVLSPLGLASRLIDVRPVDDEYLMLTFSDGKVHYQDDGKGPTAFQSGPGGGDDRVERFGVPLDTTAATLASNYRISSVDAPAYKLALSPLSCSRRSKVNGTAWAWPDPVMTLDHTIFLKLPAKLSQGKRYTLAIQSFGGVSEAKRSFTFDAYRSPTEALHVNLLGYNPLHPEMKSADLYMWLGDAGARDYTSYVGRSVRLVDVVTGTRHEVGKVKFWKPSGPDVGKWNLTASPVWNCDFSSFKGVGRFRLAVEGVGCSPEITLARNVY
jgi:hypothetical protein